MNWLRLHWRSFAAAALALALFAAGHYSAAKPTVHETVRTEYEDRVVEKVVTVQAEQKTETKVVYRDRVVKPDGTVHEQTEERTEAKTAETERVTDGKTETAQAETQRTLTVTSAKPDWRVGVLLGASLHTPVLPVAGPLVLGAEVDRRIAGPFWLGLWAQTGGSAGLSLSVEF